MHIYWIRYNPSQKDQVYKCWGGDTSSKFQSEAKLNCLISDSSLPESLSLYTSQTYVVEMFIGITYHNATGKNGDPKLISFRIIVLEIVY